MASLKEIEPRALRFAPSQQPRRVVTLAPVPIPPRRSPGWLDPRSLRAQTVAMFLLLLTFAAGSLVITIGELRAYVASHAGAKGIARLRRVVELAEPKAASPMETRLRMLLVLARLPRPEVQVSIHDGKGHFLGRPDLLYRN